IVTGTFVVPFYVIPTYFINGISPGSTVCTYICLPPCPTCSCCVVFVQTLMMYDVLVTVCMPRYNVCLIILQQLIQSTCIHCYPCQGCVIIHERLSFNL